MRIAIFCVLGPPIGGLVVIAAGLFGGVSIIHIASVLIYFLIGAYVIGFAPAMVTCQADDYLADKLSLWPRVAVVAVVGAALTFIWLAIILGLSQFRSEPLRAPGFGVFLMGAFPAAVCSLLAGWYEGQE